ncbi:MAG: tesA [Planctomycetaceae bacterium]|nr:tesA [Planctomycetaceae bacterium]
MQSHLSLVVSLIAFLLANSASLRADDSWPALPAKNGTVSILAQEWPLKPGPRSVSVAVHYPGGQLDKITDKTGLMLSLHNWGGSGCIGTADPAQLAERFNVICLCVDYLQSGPKASIMDPEPYDFGYLQALDALRALSWLDRSLTEKKVAFARGRVYATGGSGGGNVTLMVNKLAPRTFACCIDLCGMAKLSDDIAFNLPGGSDLNARFVKDAKHPYYLSPDHQELRFVGHPGHLKMMRALGNSCRMLVVHGVDDHTCPIEDAREMVANIQASGLTVEPKWVAKADLDGKVFSSSGHSLGNRTLIVFQRAEKYLLPDSPEAAVRSGLSDFDRKDDVVFQTANGQFVISYRAGYPIGQFVSR